MKKIVMQGMLVVCVIFLGLGFGCIDYIHNNYNVKDRGLAVKYVRQDRIIPEAKAEVAVENDAVFKTVENNVEEVVEYSGNNIQIGNNFNSALMKDEDGTNFYIDHNINGIYDGRGVPYIDFRTDFYTRKTIIYAHSMTSGNGPFQILQNYHYNKGFYDNNRYITVNYGGNTYTYEIFSVYVSVADSEESEGLEYFHRMGYSTEEWNQTVKKYKANSEYDTGVEVSGNDKILILQTCSMDSNYYEQYYRYNLLVMGKLV